ncbi:MAG: hypothetical protein IT195_14170 [Microthrixaceae bacterium]|nr:hypothetical protein [Microthrixaceae bacterium]
MNDTLLKNLKSLAIAGLGAGLTVVLQGVSGMDFGAWTPAVVAMSSVLVNFLKTITIDKAETK